ncbi:MAG: ABC transporter substrate-binding protein [Dehalococcoidia bacterium]|nr:ABC transporter substrate-binding protein [Dehalococcoidia bacterium]
MALRNGLVFSLVMVAVLAVLAACGETVVEVPVEKVVEVEVPVEKVVEVEVPVEKVVEVEVPVEKVVEVEVPVVKNLIVNNLQECAASYDQEVDYFPDKTEAQYAKEWWVEYFNNYKVVTVDTDRSPDAQNLIRYVLVQCGTPEPELSGDLADAMVVEVPVQRFWEGGGATFAALDALGALDRLIGVNTRTSGSQNHFLPNVTARVAQDEVHKESSYGEDLELILNGDPDVYFQYNGDDWRNNALQVGVPAIHYSPFSEGPLGSAEQVKFVSLFFNLEARADRYFEPIAEEYNRIKELAQGQTENPSVLLGTIASSGQFQSRNRTRLESILIEDAGGARPLLKAVDQGFLDGTAHLGFGGVAVETALEHGEGAEYWFELAFRPRATNVPEYLERNPLNSSFPALEQGNAFHRYGRAVDYHSTGAVRVDILLKDIISIIHPDLLPAHQLVFLDRIETAAEIGVIASNPQGPVEEYIPGADYFPDKVEVKWAKDWTVSYHGNYKIVHMGPVGDANAGSRETYALVQKGTPAPELTGNLSEAQVIEIPIESVFENSGGGSIVIALEYLGEAESLIGLGYVPFGDFSQVTPETDKRYKSDDFLVADVSGGWETVIEASPEIVVVPFSATERVTARSLGLNAVFFNSYWETPLGSAEHLKFWSLFFNKEKLANELFAPVEIEYVALARQVAEAVPVETRPAIMHGSITRSGSWFTFGPDRIDYHLIRDAGGTPVLIDANLALDAFASISMEEAVEIGAGADFWWNSSYDALDNGADGDAWVAQDPLNANIPALENGTAFHIFKRGEDYYKTAVNYRADLLLKDLVSIIHPELAPNHETIWLELITPPSQ